MELTSEDGLRLQVLARTADAIRVQETPMEVHGLSLSESGVQEGRVVLHPNCRPDQYLRRVREFLSGIVLGSPGGYPVHLARWTRMGQARDAGLAKLLLLGEPEAVTAVAGAPGLTDELARCVWWIAPESEHARRMLERKSVAGGRMGTILAAHLIEHLPFETDTRMLAESVRLILQPGLVPEAERALLWARGRRVPAYWIGFLHAGPDQLPVSAPERTDLPSERNRLEQAAARGNPMAIALLRALSGPGQSFATVVSMLLERPRDRDVVTATLNAIGRYYRTDRLHLDTGREVGLLCRQAQALCTASAEIDELLVASPALKNEVVALLVLGAVTESLISEILAHSSADGTLLQRKLAPITQAIRAQLAVLNGPP